MRVGIDIQICRWVRGGIYTYIWNVIEGLTRLERPPELTLFLFGQPGMQEPEQVARMLTAFPQVRVQYLWDDIPVTLLSNGRPRGSTPAPRWAREVDRRLLRPLWRRAVAPQSALVSQVGRVVRLARRRSLESRLREVDVLHHTAGLLFPLHLAANVLTVHDLIPVHLRHYYPGDWEWFGEAFERASESDVILTYSEYTKQDIVDTLKVSAEQIRVVPLAAHEQYRPVDDPGAVLAVLARYGLADRPYVLHVGLVEPRKNLARLVEAFHVVRQEGLVQHRLVLVGAKGWLSEDVFDTIRHLKLTEHVTWIDHARFEDLPVLYSGADVFAFPSIFEGFGLPPLEAMACGTPVIASNVTSIPEVIGDAGLLFDPYQVREIAEAMHRVLTDAGLRATLRTKGPQRAQTFSWARTAQLTLAAYDEACERARSRRASTREGAGLTTIRLRNPRPRNYVTTRAWVIEQLTRRAGV